MGKPGEVIWEEWMSDARKPIPPASGGGGVVKAIPNLKGGIKEEGEGEKVVEVKTRKFPKFVRIRNEDVISSEDEASLDETVELDRMADLSLEGKA